MIFFPTQKLYVVSEFLIIVMIYGVNIVEEAIFVISCFIVVLLCLEI